MDLMESLRTLRRRWILTSVLLLLTLAASAAALVKLPWTYQSAATTVLLASKNAAKPAGGNPYLVFDGSLTLTADVVRREVMDPRTTLDLATHGYTASYMVVAAPDTTGPVLLITVTGKDKSIVEHTLYGVTNEVSNKLLELQSSLAPANRITMVVVSLTPQATLSAGKKAKPLVVVLGLGLILTFAIPQIVDAQANRKRARREIAAQPGRAAYPGDPVTAGRHGIRYPDNEVTRSSPDADVNADQEAGYGYRLDPDDQTPVNRGRLR